MINIFKDFQYINNGKNGQLFFSKFLQIFFSSRYSDLIDHTACITEGIHCSHAQARNIFWKDKVANIFLNIMNCSLSLIPNCLSFFDEESFKIKTSLFICFHFTKYTTFNIIWKCFNSRVIPDKNVDSGSGGKCISGRLKSPLPLHIAGVLFLNLRSVQKVSLNSIHVFNKNVWDINEQATRKKCIMVEIYESIRVFNLPCCALLNLTKLRQN